jgi:biotin transporter BioY
MTKRPIGISVISFLFFIASLSILVATLGLSFKLGSVFGYLLAFVLFAFGFGLFKRKKWAWWLTSIMLMSLVMVDIFAIVTSAGMSELQVKAFPGKLAQFALHSVLLYYLFQLNVIRYFQFDEGQRKKNAIKVAMFSLLIWVGAVIFFAMNKI